MVLNSLFPVFALIILGNLLKHFKVTNDIFLKTSDRLVYFIFFPALLFWKIGAAPLTDVISWSLCKAVICSLMILYMLSCISIRLLKVSNYQAGSFSQSCYRFNTYIGMAIILNSLGEEGVRQFGILVGVVIPIINVMAVSTLIWYSGKSFKFRERSRLTLRALVSNPLIIACILGIIYAQTINGFPVFIDNTLRLSTYVTLPLALISIGSALTVNSLKGHFKFSFAASLLKLLVLPIIGYLCLKIFHVSDIPFKVGMIYFALPTSTAIYILSSQLFSDTELASASIVMSTILSFISLSIVLSFI